MPKSHVGSFFNVPTSNPADFDLLIINFGVQINIFFKYTGGTSYKIIIFKNPAVCRTQGCQFFEGQLYFKQKVICKYVQTLNKI